MFIETIAYMNEKQKSFLYNKLCSFNMYGSYSFNKHK